MKTMKKPFREMLAAVPADLFELYHYSLLFSENCWCALVNAICTV